MNRLQLELHRLYLTQESAGHDAPAVEPYPIDSDAAAVSLDDVVPGHVSLDTRPIDTAASGTLIDAKGQVRALVLELARPADWPLLSAVWNAVQTDLELPAPAIAVNGRDGYQLWFSLAQPVPAAQGLDWLDALRQRYLAEVKPQRVALLPVAPASTTDATAALPTRHADLVLHHEVAALAINAAAVGIPGTERRAWTVTQSLSPATRSRITWSDDGLVLTARSWQETTSPSRPVSARDEIRVVWPAAR